MMQKFRPDREPSSDAGFTFIELVITILLLGILSSLALYSGNKTITPQKKSLAAQQLIDDINYARTLAISSNDLITIEFSDSDNHYTVYKGDGNTLVQNFPNGSGGVVDFLDLNLGSTNLSNIDFNGTNRLRLMPKGVPEFGGTLTINDVTLTVSELTGKCTIN